MIGLIRFIMFMCASVKAYRLALTKGNKFAVAVEEDGIPIMIVTVSLGREAILLEQDIRNNDEPADADACAAS